MLSAGEPHMLLVKCKVSSWILNAVLLKLNIGSELEGSTNRVQVRLSEAVQCIMCWDDISICNCIGLVVGCMFAGQLLTHQRTP